MKILLIEPNYKNKYPPMGLMKISTYHKTKGDYVFFAKGTINFEKIWDRIYITSLFTFDYKTVVKTINHYKTIARSSDDIFVGGIAASLMSEKLRTDTGLKNIIPGRLTNSSQVGFYDDVNIDSLPLDYDILMDTDYNYAAEGKIISYTSRGCKNTCDFCAVPILEGPLSSANSIKSQVLNTRETYSDMKDLLLLDNNILGFGPNYLTKLADDLNDLGYVNNPTFLKPNRFESLMKYYYRQLNTQGRTINAIKLLKDYLNSVKDQPRISQENKLKLSAIMDKAQDAEDFVDVIEDHYNVIYSITQTYTTKIPYQRYVDFNQGLDARELTEEKMKILSRIPIKPYRFAFDSTEFTKCYEDAVTLASTYGVKSFSNYLLYNFNDTPEDLYARIMVNLKLAEKLKVNIYSFPMKYASIERTDRSHVGNNWNLHFLRIFQSILNVTKGVVAGDRTFIERAFGTKYEDFIEILHMPHDFVVYRTYYENCHLAGEWQLEYRKLSLEQRAHLIEILSDTKYNTDEPSLQKIMTFYRMRYNQLNISPKTLKQQSIS